MSLARQNHMIHVSHINFEGVKKSPSTMYGYSPGREGRLARGPNCSFLIDSGLATRLERDMVTSR